MRQRNVAIATYYYFIAKVVDLMDTLFFVLTKKNGHISFLHIYHHALMVVVTYFAVKFLPGKLSKEYYSMLMDNIRNDYVSNFRRTFVAAGTAQLNRTRADVYLLLPDVQQFKTAIVGHMEDSADPDSNGN